MDPGRLCVAACVVMVCLLGAARLSCAGNCFCPKIPKKNFTEDLQAHCYNISDRHRYKCVHGYVRKAGTSNLIKCEEKDGAAKWTESLLECIPDPKLPPPTQFSPDEVVIATNPPNPQETPTTLRHDISSTSAATSTENTEQGASGTKIMTTVQSCTVPSSTYTSSSHHNKNSSVTGAYLEANSKTVGASLCVVGLLFVIGAGVLYLLYRRRKKPTPMQEPEEMQPMSKAV